MSVPWPVLHRSCLPPRSASPAGPHRSPVSSRHHSSSSRSGSSVQRHSLSPRRKRSPSPSYQRTLTPPLRRSASPYPASHALASPQRKQSPTRQRSPPREKGRHEHERASQAHDRRHERREGMRLCCVFISSSVTYVDFFYFETWTFRCIVTIRVEENCYSKSSVTRRRVLRVVDDMGM